MSGASTGSGSVTARLLRYLGRAAALGPRGWRDLVRAAVELAIARRALDRRSIGDLLSPRAAQKSAPAALTPAEARLVERVAYAVSRTGARVPWRADCLVQALAARRWLERHGVASNLYIGVRNEGEFAAHAWLKVGDEVVTGGPIADYVSLLAPGIDQERSASVLATNQR
jgi:hypothetical protein